MNHHLSDNDFTDCLMGTAHEDVTEHLDDCPACRHELDRAQANLGNFRTASLAWGEAKSQGISHAVTAARASRFAPVMPWHMACAAMLIVLALPVGVYKDLHLHREEVLRRQAAMHAAQVNRDDRLLEAVNRELAEEVAPAMEPLMVTTSSSTQTETAGQNVQTRGDL